MAHIEKGERQWIELVPACAKKTDARYAEELPISLASGLTANPSAALAALTTENTSPCRCGMCTACPY